MTDATDNCLDKEMEKTISKREMFFSFWNCALVPPKFKDRVCSDLDIEIVIEIISKMFNEFSASFVCLCEINERYLKLIVEALAGDDYLYCNYDSKTETGGRFDLAIIYKKSQIEITYEEPHSTALGTSRVKVAQQIELTYIDTGVRLCLFISHWPSDVHESGSIFRNMCASGLRKRFEKILEENKNVILMGDYNTPPYSNDLVDILRATNDRSLTLSASDFWIYNPFWSTLTARVPFDVNVDEHDSGTCYSPKGYRGHWSSFDQILFSGNFLKSPSLYINEKKTGRFYDKDLLDLIRNDYYKIDHFPVIGCLINEVQADD